MKIILISLLIFALLGCASIHEKPHDASKVEPFEFNIPPRVNSDRGASSIIDSIRTLDLVQREKVLFKEVEAGNIPGFLIKPVDVTFTQSIEGIPYRITLFVMSDYFTLGTDDDYFLIPMTPMLAQKVMDRLDATLPTRRIVNLIWEAAKIKMTPTPIPPSEAMVTVDVFQDHQRLVSDQRHSQFSANSMETLVSGHKKDVILANGLSEQSHRVFIYGWHYPQGNAIQPLYSGHAIWYVDYSHGIRVVLDRCLVNDVEMRITDILKDPVLFQLLSDEAGAMEVTRYDTSSSYYP